MGWLRVPCRAYALAFWGIMHHFSQGFTAAARVGRARSKDHL